VLFLDRLACPVGVIDWHPDRPPLARPTVQKALPPGLGDPSPRGEVACGLGPPVGVRGAAPHAPIPAKRRPASEGRLRARNLVAVPGQVKRSRRLLRDRSNVAQARHFCPDFCPLAWIAMRSTMRRCRLHSRQRTGCLTFAVAVAWNHSAGCPATRGAVLSYGRRMPSNCMQNRHEPGKTKNK
jgi:hypothetical protein